ncbi:hypothetical protein [Paraburkholderia terrae]|uniref:hypothetical protein n=1 Tax=Paraburkholderia terrae TaxID=311230 RepID=UPI0020BFEA60|nr:hypothetical protein [Paraburkholderia terrae]
MDRKRRVDDRDIEVRRVDVLHAGAPELTIETCLFKYLLALRDHVGVHVDAVDSMALRIGEL